MATKPVQRRRARKPIVLLADADARTSYVASKLDEGLKDLADPLVIIPLTEGIWDGIEARLAKKKDHPLLDAVVQCLDKGWFIGFVVDNPEVKKELRLLQKADVDKTIVSYSSVTLMDAADGLNAIETALELAKADRGSCYSFSVSQEANEALSKYSVKTVRWGRWPRGRRAGPEPVKPEAALVEAVAALVDEKIAGRFDELLAKIGQQDSADVVDRLERIENTLDSIRAWMQPTEAAVVPMADVKPRSRLVIRSK